MYLHLMQLSVTTNAMTYPSLFRLVGNPILPQPQNAQAAPAAASDANQTVDRLFNSVK
jgi:hypothetical protein